VHRMYLVNVQTELEMFRTNFLEKSGQILCFQFTISVNVAFKTVISLKKTNGLVFIFKYPVRTAQ